MNETTIGLILDVARGNPGAIRVLTDVALFPSQHDVLFKLHTSNVRGSAVWVLFKDRCAENYDDFCRVVRELEAADLLRLSEV